MAATRLIVLHVNKGKTVLQSLKDRIDYAQNPEKTEKGKLISSYECDPKTAAEEFLLAKKNYERITGNPRRGSVLAYQIRQSFRPGEITAEEANRVGHELAMSFTKGNHAFVVATHTDRKHIHNHIIFNAVTLDEDRKFRNFHRSNMALHRASDRICLEHGLSIIYPGEKELEYLQQIAKSSDGKHMIEKKKREQNLNFLIDIQEKVREGKGKGYENWAKKFNLKQMAQALCFLQENGIESYEELVKRKDDVQKQLQEIRQRITDVEQKMSELSELRTHIFNYSKTRDVYFAYRKSGWSRQFFEAHREEITLHRAAKKAFEKQKSKKLPKVKGINAEFTELAKTKKSLYAEYRQIKNESRDFLIAEKNIATILGVDAENEARRRAEKIKNANRNDLGR